MNPGRSVAQTKCVLIVQPQTILKSRNQILIKGPYILLDCYTIYCSFEMTSHKILQNCIQKYIIQTYILWETTSLQLSNDLCIVVWWFFIGWIILQDVSGKRRCQKNGEKTHWWYSCPQKVIHKTNTAPQAYFLILAKSLWK